MRHAVAGHFWEETSHFQLRCHGQLHHERTCDDGFDHLSSRPFLNITSTLPRNQREVAADHGGGAALAFRACWRGVTLGDVLPILGR